MRIEDVHPKMRDARIIGLHSKSKTLTVHYTYTAAVAALEKAKAPTPAVMTIMALVDRSERLTFVVRQRPDGREEIAITTHAGIAERNERRAGEF